MFNRRNSNWMKQGALTGVFLYLFALVGPVAHAAEYGPDAHEHGGNPCEVHDLVKQIGAALGVDDAAQVPVFYAVPDRAAPADQIDLTDSDVRLNAPRAPPA
ncbi:MAG: hypothetical protein ACE363_04425 [Alphaproteobacteria bacterium]